LGRLPPFFEIKGFFFSIFFKNDKTDLRQIFFKVLEKTLVYYNLHCKAMHPVFKLTFQTIMWIACHKLYLLYPKI